MAAPAIQTTFHGQFEKYLANFCIYLLKGVERALEQELGDLGHSQSFDLKSSVTVGWSLSSLGLLFLVFKWRVGPNFL